MRSVALCDSWVEWSDVRVLSARPMGDRPVVVGLAALPHAPDQAAIHAAAVLAPPICRGASFRVLETATFYPTQDLAAWLQRLAGRYAIADAVCPAAWGALAVRGGGLVRLGCLSMDQVHQARAVAVEQLVLLGEGPSLAWAILAALVAAVDGVGAVGDPIAPIRLAPALPSRKGD